MVKNNNVLPEFTFGQSSQQRETSPEVFERAVDSILDSDTSIVALTEVYGIGRSRNLAEMGYLYHHEVDTDSAAIWHDDTWENLYALTAQVTSKFWFRATGKRTSPQKAIFVVLRNRDSGHVVLLIASHFPPGVEGKQGPGGIWRLSTIRRWTSGLDALVGIRKIRRQLRREFNPDATIISADWNLDIKRAAVRRWVTATFPRMEPNVPKNYSGRGTLGRRFVDFSMVQNLSVVSNPQVKEIVGSDHRAVFTKLKFKKRARNPLPKV